MKRTSYDFIEDALSAVDQILWYTKEKSFNNFRADDLLRAAVEGKFEILGEAAIEFQNNCKRNILKYLGLK